MAEKTQTLIRLDSDLKKSIEELAKKDDRSFNNYVVKILQDHVQNQTK
ncbi:hypothetical protein QU593_09750 [Rossellomorea marisflavi]|nr:hypothetical protein [Rossellomorea marisflavi]WJV20686.1 hypothetical protein QU593_09750 [Rossellomorea marisflavi]